MNSMNLNNLAFAFATSITNLDNREKAARSRTF